MNNIVIDQQNGLLEIKINKELFPQDVVINACYEFLEKAYIVVDKEGSYYKVIIKPKDNKDLEKLAFEFYSQLLSEYALEKQMERTEQIRQLIIEQALSNYVELEQLEMEEQAYREQEEIYEEIDNAMHKFRNEENVGEVSPDVEELFVKDPLGIATPWEFKYGKSENKSSD